MNTLKALAMLARTTVLVGAYLAVVTLATVWFFLRTSWPMVLGAFPWVMSLALGLRLVLGVAIGILPTTWDLLGTAACAVVGIYLGILFSFWRWSREHPS